MSEFFKSTGFKILIAVVLIMFGVILYTASVNDSVLSSALSFITSPIQKVSTNLSNTISNITNRQDTDEMQQRIDELESEVRDLRDLTVDYYDIKHENAQLVKHFDLKQKDSSLKLVPSSIIGRDPNEDFYAFTIDEGAISGISVGDPVTTENGLIGTVYSVSANSCKVRTILSPDVNVGVVDTRTGDSGVVTGSAKLADSNLSRLTYISADSDLKAGDILATSGLSGMYPRNVQLGKIKELGYDEHDATPYAVVEPFENILTVKEVFVIIGFQGKGNLVTDEAKTQVDLQSDTTSSGGNK